MRQAGHAQKLLCAEERSEESAQNAVRAYHTIYYELLELEEAMTKLPSGCKSHQFWIPTRVANS